MNQGAHVVQTQPLVQAPVRRQANAWAPASSSWPSTPKRLAIVREMLPTVECATLAGQRYLMGKIVTFLDEVAANGYAGIGGRLRFMLAHRLGRLRQEAARPLPDAARFIQYARDVLTFLDDLA